MAETRYDANPAAARVTSIRPRAQELAVPSFIPSVTSVPSNVYVSEIQAGSHDERSITWSWRSPSSGLLMSPLAHGVFHIKVTAPYKLSREDMVGTLLGSFDTQHAIGGRGVAADDVAATIRKGYGYRPLLMFGSGNCVENSTENLTVSINGATWQQLNGHLYSRSLDRCFVPLDVQQRSYSTCGGACNAMDDKPVSGHVLGLPDTMIVAPVAANNNGGVGLDTSRNLQCLEAAAVTNGSGYRAIEGQTVDSSVSQRMSNFYDQVIKSSDITAASHTITLEIKFPIQGGPFNSLFGASGLSRSDPRLRMALGIANYNQGQITYSFRNLIKNIIRRLGRPARLVNVAGAAPLNSTSRLAGSVSAFTSDDITVEYDSSYTPRLYLTYIRLPSFRSYPASSAITVYRRDVRKPVNQVVGNKSFDAGLFDGANNIVGLQCASGLSSRPSTMKMRTPSTSDAAVLAKHEVEVKWNGIQFPQPPNQLFIVFQKSSDVFNLNNPLVGIQTVQPPTAVSQALKWETIAAGESAARAGLFGSAANTNLRLMNQVALPADANAEAVRTFDQELAGRYLAQNNDSNASIMMIEITVQSAVGSWSFKSSGNYPYTRDRDELWQKHVANCCDGYCKAGRGKWQDRESCALIGVEDYLLGLATSPGTVFPVILDLKVKFANRAAISSGLCFTNGQSRGQQFYDDFICGTPVCVGLFNQQILSIASSSAVISAQAFSQATTASALAQG